VNAKNVGKWKKNVRVRTLPGNPRKVWIFIEVLEFRKVWNSLKKPWKAKLMYKISVKYLNI
jgi:hypothetical protein